MPEFSLTKMERLSGERVIARLFEEGKGAFAWPFRYLFRAEPAAEAKDGTGVAMLVSVSKRNFKSAVQRNQLKRRTREAYRLNKHALIDAASEKGLHVHLGLVYSSKDTVAYHDIERAIQKILAAVIRDL